MGKVVKHYYLCEAKYWKTSDYTLPFPVKCGLCGQLGNWSTWGIFFDNGTVSIPQARVHVEKTSDKKRHEAFLGTIGYYGCCNW